VQYYFAMAIVNDDGTLPDDSEIPLDPALNIGIQKVIRTATGVYDVYPIPPIDPVRSVSTPNYISNSDDDVGLMFTQNPSTSEYIEVYRYDIDSSGENGPFSLELKTFP